MLEPKDLTVYLDATGSLENSGHLTYAAGLASCWSAHLIVALSPAELAFTPHTGFARGSAMKHVIDTLNRRKGGIEEELRSLIDKVCIQFDITSEIRTCEGEYGEALMLHARHSTLAVLGSDCRPERQVSALSLAEDVIFASGRPSILVPPEWPAARLPRKIVIGWNGSREAARAISDAMPLITTAEAVHVVVIPEAKISGLLGQEPGADISRHLARYGVAVQLDRLDHVDAGAGLLSHAKNVGAELMVIGAYGQSKITTFVFGSATQTLLANADIPVLLSR